MAGHRSQKTVSRLGRVHRSYAMTKSRRQEEVGKEQPCVSSIPDMGRVKSGEDKDVPILR